LIRIHSPISAAGAKTIEPIPDGSIFRGAGDGTTFPAGLVVVSFFAVLFMISPYGDATARTDVVTIEVNFIIRRVVVAIWLNYPHWLSSIEFDLLAFTR
jgi:hypothetical protein